MKKTNIAGGLVRIIPGKGKRIADASTGRTYSEVIVDAKSAGKFTEVSTTKKK